MSAIDDLTTVPDQPQISEGNKTFSQKTFALWLWIRTKLVPAMVELRDLIVNSVTGAYSGVSSSSVTVADTGEISITTDTGRSFKPGTPVRLAYVADPRIYIDGITKTYNASTGAFVFYAQAKAGSGTYTSWSLTIIPSGGGLAGLGSNTFSGAQFVPDDPYDAGAWNGSSAVPTKNAIRDALVALIDGLPTLRNSANDPSFSSASGTEAVSTQWVKSGLAISLGSNGYLKMPSWMGGLIIQWGTGAGPITFPLTFPGAALNVIVQINQNSSTPVGTNQYFISSLVREGFSRADGSNSCRYIAIGY